MKYLAFSFLLLVVLTACGDASLTQTPVLEATTTNATIYKGRATAVQAKAVGVNVQLADTGALPTKGGTLSKTVATAEVPTLLSAGVLQAATIGQGNHTRSEASVSGLNLSVAGVGIEAAFIGSQAVTSCNSSGRAAVSGTSQLTGLVINGKKITVSGEPNQTILVFGLVKVVINEQTGSAGGATGKNTVNALHVQALQGVVDVTIAASQAEITCKQVRPSYGDFITGSGSINARCSANCGAFSLSGGRKNSGLFGNLTYVDSATNLTLRGTRVTAYTVVNSRTRLIKGTATVNGRGGFRYEVRAADNGKGSSDTFKIKIFDGANQQTYTASGRLVCGNLQLHSTSPTCSCN